MEIVDWSNLTQYDLAEVDTLDLRLQVWSKILDIVYIYIYIYRDNREIITDIISCIPHVCILFILYDMQTAEIKFLK